MCSPAADIPDADGEETPGPGDPFHREPEHVRL
jgi:hypothetical protein